MNIITNSFQKGEHFSVKISKTMVSTVKCVCDLHSAVQRGERVPINTATTLLLQQDLHTPLMT